jgi:hypothetical protein
MGGVGGAPCAAGSTHMNPPARDGVSSDLPGIGALHIDVPMEVLLTGTHFRVQGEVLQKTPGLWFPSFLSFCPEPVPANYI